MLINKKGIAMDTVIGLILALVALVIIAGVMYVVLVEKEDVFTRKICQISVYFSDQSLGIFNKLGVGGIFCRTYYKEFKNLKKEDFLKKTAENMRQCWWMWGEGERDPAGPNLVKWSDYQCFNCYVIEPLEEIPEITSGELEKYLQKEYIGDSDITYWNYFKGFNNNKIIFNFPSLGDPVGDSFNKKQLFEKGKFYAITFVENTQPSVLARMLSVGAVGYVACLVPVGPGALICGYSVATTVLVGAETILENSLVTYFRGDEDAIMISEFDERENVCSGEIG